MFCDVVHYVTFMFWKLYVSELLRCVQLRFVTLRHVTSTLCCLTLCSNILQGPELHQDVSGQQEPLLLLDVYTTGAAPGHVWTSGSFAAPGRLYTTGSWAAPRRVWTTGACPGLDWFCLHYIVHLDVCIVQRPMLQLNVSIPQGLELHLVVSRLHEPVLLLDMSTVHYRGLWCTWTCLQHRGLSFI